MNVKAEITGGAVENYTISARMDTDRYRENGSHLKLSENMNKPVPRATPQNREIEFKIQISVRISHLIFERQIAQ